MLTKQEVASFLLSEGYLLTALEFHQELVEDGSELDILKKQFGAPPPQSSDLYSLNTESFKLPDNVEAAMKEKDDRLTLLEYELRMAKQQVNQMREKINKTSLNTSIGPKSTSTLSTSSTFKGTQLMIISLIPGNSRTEIVSDLESAAPRDTEIRAINYIVMKYLLTQGFKVSAVTFEEEVSDHSVSDWEEIGINSPPPPNLTTFYRYFYTIDPNAPNPSASTTNSKGMDTIISSLKEEIDQLKKRAVKAEEKHAHSKKKIDILLADKKALEEKLLHMETSLQKVDTPTPQPTEEAKPAEPVVEAPPKKIRKPRRSYVEVDPNPFNIVEETESYTRISQELRMIAQERDFQSLVHILGDALPHIVPGVILKKREELIPVILSAISQHPDPNNRYSLTGLLFNLIRRPNEHERKILIDGFDSLARIIGEERTERELLPQCWEQIHDEHDERRVLVADSCGAISKYVRAELRPSLILSILHQLSQDKSHIVRQAVARNLAVLVSYFTGNEKYSQVEELVFELLNDSEADVRAVAVRVLLPIFTDWSDELEWMTSKFLTKFLNEIETQLSSNDDVALSVLFNALKTLIPRIRDSILWSIPIPANASQDPIKQLQYRIEQLSQFFEKETTGDIPELEWLLNTCLPKLTMFILKIDVSKEKASQDFINVLSTLCSVFGDTFTTITMKKVFQPHLEKEQRGKVLPFYIGGVIACVKKQKEVFTGYLKELILNVSLEENGWKRTHKNALRDAVRLLSKTDRKEETLLLLSDLVVHTASHVRSVIVALLDALVIVLHSEEVVKRVLPALVTLSADPDPAVRLEAIQALGLVAVNVEDPIVLEKVKTQFESFIEDDSHNHRVTITKVFTNMIPHVQAHFRDHFILPNLNKITERNARNPDTSHKLGLAQLLFEAYRAYTGCQSVKEQLLPGLKLLQRDADHMEAAYKSMISTMITEFEATIIKSDNVPGNKQPVQTAPGVGSGFGSFFTGVRGGVADIKNKVGKAVATPGPNPPPAQAPTPVKRP